MLSREQLQFVPGDAVMIVCRSHLEALDRIAELKLELADKTALFCAYCGIKYPADSPVSVITEHIRVCEKHPLRIAEAKIAELDATLDRADEHTAGMLERLEAMEKENATLRAQLMAYADLVRQMVTLCDAPDNTLALDAVKHCKLECTTLKARLADAERKAIEEKRRAWDEGVKWVDAHEGNFWHREWANDERDRRYPLPPKEEGR
jgi:hypothetical protein